MPAPRRRAFLARPAATLKLIATLSPHKTETKDRLKLAVMRAGGLGARLGSDVNRESCAVVDQGDRREYPGSSAAVSESRAHAEPDYPKLRDRTF